MSPLLSFTLLRAQSDRRLLALAQAGHAAAFTAIVERYRPQLRRYCLRILPEARVDDAVQQALLHAWRALEDGSDVRKLRPWLFTIAHNEAINQLRHGVFDYVELMETIEGDCAPHDDLERRAVMRQTLAAVAALPERQRDALLAVALQGRPPAQVAAEMGLTDNGLRQLVFRARSAVRAAASALTPLPMLTWVLRPAASSGGHLGERMAEVAAGGGTAIVVAGTLAVGGGVALRSPSGEPGLDPARPLTKHAAPPRAQPHATSTTQRPGPAVASPAAAERGLVFTAAPTARHAKQVAALRGARGLRVSSPAKVQARPDADEADDVPASLTPAAASPAAPAPAPPTATTAAAPADEDHDEASGDATSAPEQEPTGAPHSEPVDDHDERDGDEHGDDGDRDDVAARADAETDADD